MGNGRKGRGKGERRGTDLDNTVEKYISLVSPGYRDCKFRMALMNFYPGFMRIYTARNSQFTVCCTGVMFQLPFCSNPGGFMVCLDCV